MVDRIELNIIIAVVALTSVVFGVFVKIATRHDSHQAFSKNDLAIGLDLLTSSVIIVATRAGSHSPFVLFAMVVILWFISTVIRKIGWISEGQLDFRWGVVMPNLVGFVSLASTVTLN